MATLYCHIYFSFQFLPFIYLFIVLYSPMLSQTPDKSCPQCSLMSVLSYKMAQHVFYLMGWSVFCRNRNHYELEAVAIRGHKHPTTYCQIFQRSDNKHQEKQIIHNTGACNMHTLTPKHTQPPYVHTEEVRIFQSEEFVKNILKQRIFTGSKMYSLERASRLCGYRTLHDPSQVSSFLATITLRKQ